MRNIRAANGMASSDEGSGVIGHRPFGDHGHLTFTFDVDREKRKFAVAVNAPDRFGDDCVISKELRFEWTFRE